MSTSAKAESSSAPFMKSDELQREQQIVRTSIIGIVANVFLAAFKAGVGFISGSIAIILDAVNNLSDAASSVITIVGTKLARKEPDKAHPFGYGRIEYLSALLISIIVLYAGITSLTESVKKILHPEQADYSAVTLIIVAAGVVVKLLLGRFVKQVGEKVNSDSLVNSGQDALLDSIISASTLAAAILYLLSGLSLEAWLGAVISLVIIKSGIEMIRETLSKILGDRADVDFANQIKATVRSFPEVSGAYDLVLHDYGPDRFNGSIHVEVPDSLSINDLDQLNRDIETTVYQDHGVILTAIGVYAVNTKDPETVRVREEVRSLVMGIDHVLQMHGFHYDPEKKNLRFDVVIAFSAGNRGAVWRKVCETVADAYPGYTLQIAADTDFNS
ncbi:MAG: cation diffusion facilitator family transporter [Lachnospiraceae bacterium]|nr:cation diffusion facilitator family transporter [Lachnospiraceae bacterium]